MLTRFACTWDTLGDVIPTQQDVGRLEVEVHDEVAVQEVQAPRDVQRDLAPQPWHWGAVVLRVPAAAGDA